MNSRSSVIGLALALGACGASNPPVTSGDQQVDPIFAASIYSDVCVSTAPSFTDAGTAAANRQFKEEPGSGTYFHEILYLRITVAETRDARTCTMIFATDAFSDDDALVLRTDGVEALDTTVSVQGRDGNLTIVSVAGRSAK